MPDASLHPTSILDVPRLDTQSTFRDLAYAALDPRVRSESA